MADSDQTGFAGRPPIHPRQRARSHIQSPDDSLMNPVQRVRLITADRPERQRSAPPPLRLRRLPRGRTDTSPPQIPRTMLHAAHFHPKRRRPTLAIRLSVIALKNFNKRPAEKLRSVGSPVNRPASHKDKQQSQSLVPREQLHPPSACSSAGRTSTSSVAVLMIPEEAPLYRVECSQEVLLVVLLTRTTQT